MAHAARTPIVTRDVRQGWLPSIVGPLFFYDIVRLARRGRSTLLRTVYAAALLASLLYAYHERFPGHDLWSAPLASPASLPVIKMARLAAEFVYSILWIQTIAIFVLTPAYLASAIAEEKERRTLELLFTTHVSDHEIVLGKLMARLTHLAAILLTGLPLLVLTQLWGGVDIHHLVAAFIGTALSLGAVGAICMLCSVTCRTVMGAVLLSYAFTAAFAFVSMEIPDLSVANPAGMFKALAQLDFDELSAVAPARGLPLSVAECLTVSALYNGLAMVVFARLAVVWLRPSSEPTLSRATYMAPDRPQQPVPIGREAATPTDRPRQPGAIGGSLPRVGDWPLLWKETYHGRADLNGQRGGFLLVIVPIAFLLILVRQNGNGPRNVDPVGSLLGPAILFVAGVWCSLVAFRSAAAITKEREQGTLDALLTLPMSRSELLGAKWLGPILFSRVVGYVLVFLILAGILTGTLHPIAAILMVFLVAAHLGFLASLGLVLSLASRNALWARVTMGLVLLVFLGITLRVLMINLRSARPTANPLMTRSAGPVPPFGTFSWRILPWPEFISEVGVSAPGAWWFLTFSPKDYAKAIETADANFTGRLIVAEAGILAYALAARLLWAFACWRFRGAQ
jgi:ABC-type transport system involved in multi-copper enzyme maturation permease subunit